MAMDNKALIAALVCAIFVSSLLVTVAYAQTTIPKPSVPVIDVQFVNHSYYIPSKTTTSTNPYTGEQVVTTSEGYYIQNDTFVIAITGQPLANNAEVNGHGLSLYFVVGSKGHYASQWANLSSHYAVPVQGFLGGYSNWLLSGDNATYSTDDNGYSIAGFDGFIGGQYGGQIDFRACAVIGYTLTVQETPNPFNIRNPYSTEFVVVQESDWSPTQTITINSTTTSPTPSASPSSSPTQQPTTEASQTPNNTKEDFTSTAIIIGLVSVVIVLLGLLIYAKKNKK
jgi:hypothetical protein